MRRICSRLFALMALGGCLCASTARGQTAYPEDYFDKYLIEGATPPTAPARTTPRRQPSRLTVYEQGPAPKPIRTTSGGYPSQNPSCDPESVPQPAPTYQYQPQCDPHYLVPPPIHGVPREIESPGPEFAPDSTVPSPGVWPSTPGPSSPPMSPTPDLTGPATTSPGMMSPGTAAAPNQFAQPSMSQPSAAMGSQGGTSFGGGLSGGSLLASSNAPAMIGDAFGPGAFSFATIRPLVSQAFAAVGNPNGTQFDGFVAADLNHGVAGGTYFARVAGGSFVPLTYGVDTTGNGAGDLFTGLAGYAALANQLPTAPITADPNTVVNAGPFEAEATNFSAFGSNVFNIYQPLVIQIPSPSAAGGVVGRQKISENTSPIPQNRVFLGYSWFNNVPLAPGGVDVQRLSPGFEKTFLYDRFSFEARMPFASTLSSNILAGGLTPTGQIELGNLTGNIKGIIAQTETAIFTGGLQAFFPTADDVRVLAPGGQSLVDVQNQAVHLLPFLGMLLQPTDRYYVQGFLQIDDDLNGNSVRINPDGRGLRKIGRAEDPTFFYADLAFGYWLHRSMRGPITGIIPIAEIHYTHALDDYKPVSSDGFVVNTGNGRFRNTNVVLGNTIQFGSGSALTVGYGFPVGNQSYRQFSGELRVTMNHYFR